MCKKIEQFKDELAGAVAQYIMDMACAGKSEAEVLAVMGYMESFVREVIEAHELMLFRLYGEDYAAKTVIEAQEIQRQLDLVSEEDDNNENI